MRGFRVAITPRMVSGWATTPCWDMRAETSLANSSMADHTHCSITDTERKIRIQNRDRPAIHGGRRHGLPSGAMDITQVPHGEFLAGARAGFWVAQRFTAAINGVVFSAGFSRCGRTGGHKTPFLQPFSRAAKRSPGLSSRPDQEGPQECLQATRNDTAPDASAGYALRY